MFYSGVAAFALRCAPSEGLVWLSSHVERFSSLQLAIGNWQFEIGISWMGVLAQLVERLNSPNALNPANGSTPGGQRWKKPI